MICFVYFAQVVMATHLQALVHLIGGDVLA